MENITEMLKGILEGCVLELIRREQTYGYEMTRKLNAMGFTDVVDGTVYTILVRLEKRACVTVEKRASAEGPPRKFFTISDAGREELAQFWQRWNFLASKMNAFKEGNEHA